MSLMTLKDLFVHELHNLHSAEWQLVTALPTMAQVAESHRVRKGLEGQAERARRHVQRLEYILQSLGELAGSAGSAPERTVDVLMYGERVPVQSSKSADGHERTAAEPIVKGAGPPEQMAESERMFFDEHAEATCKDAVLIAGAQILEQYEIAGLSTARVHARVLGHADAERLLEQTLYEKQQFDVELTQLAESEINAQAVAAR
jgi:ferritin-like metal-binding protein YciE